jgi:hypothetical protein
MYWNLAGPAALVGAVSATVGVMLLELWLKPAYARQRVAAMLLAEIRLNVRGMTRVFAQLGENPEHVPEDVVISTLGWQAVASEIHFLPADMLDGLLLRYGQFREINDLVVRHSRKVDLILQMPLESPPLHAMQIELRHEAKTFANALRATLAGCEQTIPRLQAIIAAGPPAPIGSSAAAG